MLKVTQQTATGGMMRLKPVYDGYSVKLPNGHGELEDIGRLSSAASVQRLVEVMSFVYLKRLLEQGVIDAQ